MTARIAALGVSVLLLAGCSASGSSAVPAGDLLTASMVAAHPECAGRTNVEQPGEVSCATGKALYLVYLVPEDQASDMAAYLRGIHSTGTVTVDGPRVWVSE